MRNHTGETPSTCYLWKKSFPSWSNFITLTVRYCYSWWR